MSDYFVDTNILLRLADETSASHELVTRAVKQMLLNKNKLCIVRQNLAEFWAVATREYKANGLGWTIPQTKQHLETLLESFVLLDDNLNTTGFLEFLEKYAVQGKQVHDANLVFVMLQKEIDTPVTLNDVDFIRFGIQIIVPREEA